MSDLITSQVAKGEGQSIKVDPVSVPQQQSLVPPTQEELLQNLPGETVAEPEVEEILPVPTQFEVTQPALSQTSPSQMQLRDARRFIMPEIQSNRVEQQLTPRRDGEGLALPDRRSDFRRTMDWVFNSVLGFGFVDESSPQIGFFGDNFGDFNLELPGIGARIGPSRLLYSLASLANVPMGGAADISREVGAQIDALGIRDYLGIIGDRLKRPFSRDPELFHSQEEVGAALAQIDRDILKLPIGLVYPDIYSERVQDRRQRFYGQTEDGQYMPYIARAMSGQDLAFTNFRNGVDGRFNPFGLLGDPEDFGNDGALAELPRILLGATLDVLLDPLGSPLTEGADDLELFFRRSTTNNVDVLAPIPPASSSTSGQLARPTVRTQDIPEPRAIFREQPRLPTPENFIEIRFSHPPATVNRTTIDGVPSLLPQGISNDVIDAEIIETIRTVPIIEEGRQKLLPPGSTINTTTDVVVTPPSAVIPERFEGSITSVPDPIASPELFEEVASNLDVTVDRELYTNVFTTAEGTLVKLTDSDVVFREVEAATVFNNAGLGDITADVLRYNDDFIEYRLIPGETVGDILLEGSPISRELAESFAESLDRMYSAGITHNDGHPWNFLFDPNSSKTYIIDLEDFQANQPVGMVDLDFEDVLRGLVRERIDDDLEMSTFKRGKELAQYLLNNTEVGARLRNIDDPSLTSLIQDIDSFVPDTSLSLSNLRPQFQHTDLIRRLPSSTTDLQQVVRTPDQLALIGSQYSDLFPVNGGLSRQGIRNLVNAIPNLALKNYLDLSLRDVGTSLVTPVSTTKSKQAVDASIVRRLVDSITDRPKLEHTNTVAKQLRQGVDVESNIKALLEPSVVATPSAFEEVRHTLPDIIQPSVLDDRTATLVDNYQFTLRNVEDQFSIVTELEAQLDQFDRVETGAYDDFAEFAQSQENLLTKLESVGNDVDMDAIIQVYNEFVDNPTSRNAGRYIEQIRYRLGNQLEDVYNEALRLYDEFESSLKELQGATSNSNKQYVQQILEENRVRVDNMIDELGQGNRHSCI